MYTGQCNPQQTGRALHTLVGHVGLGMEDRADRQISVLFSSPHHVKPKLAADPAQQLLLRTQAMCALSRSWVEQLRHMCLEEKVGRNGAVWQGV